MEKKSWLWKRKSSDRSPGETSESSGSISSHSERYSDEQEVVKGSPNHMQSPEVTSKVGVTNGEVDDRIKSLTEKLSAALVNVGAKEELVKQHAKVAEEAVAGWEKAENEAANIKQQHEAAVQQNMALEVRVNHLESALKECVRQLRQARDEQEQKILEAVTEKTNEWEFTKLELESHILELQNQKEASKPNCAPAIDPNFLLKLESLEKENAILKHELLIQSEELEVRTIERDLSTQAAENSSKHQLESIKKVAKLEAECRRLQALARKSSFNNDHKAVSVSSLYVDSLTDSQSDSGEKLNSLEVDTRKMSKTEHNESELSCSDSWASALIAELDQFKNGKATVTSVPPSHLEIDIMDDFLEMERLAALPDAKSNKTQSNESENVENLLRVELETMTNRVAELEDKLGNVEVEKAELENALNLCQESLKESKAQLEETDKRMEDLQIEINTMNESKQLLEQQVVSMEVEARTMLTMVDTLKSELEREQSISCKMTVKCQELESELTRTVDTLKSEIERERSISSEMTVKCQELENDLTRKTEEVESHQTASLNEVKVKQEELAVVAADRLAECQKTISSLAIQLQSLATLEDFLTDTANLPGFSGGGTETPKASGESWNLRSNDAFKCDPDPSNKPSENSPPAAPPLMNGNTESSPPSSSSSSSSTTVSLNHGGKSKSGFGKLFSRSKSGVHIDNHQG